MKKIGGFIIPWKGTVISIQLMDLVLLLNAWILTAEIGSIILCRWAHHITDWKNMHRAMAVLYRPITTEAGDYYDIEEYDGTDKYAEVMKGMTMDVVLGALVFFYHLGIDLSIVMTDYLEQEMNTTSLPKQTSEESGDGTAASINLLKETLQSLKQLADFPYIPLWYTLNLKKRK